MLLAVLHSALFRVDRTTCTKTWKNHAQNIQNTQSLKFLVSKQLIMKIETFVLHQQNAITVSYLIPKLKIICAKDQMLKISPFPSIK